MCIRDSAYIALDIGPTGKLLQPMGDLPFERAVELFAKVIACIRIAVPYTGMIISTRESQQVRERALGLGLSLIHISPPIGAVITCSLM